MSKANRKPASDADHWEKLRCLRHGCFKSLFADRYHTRGYYHFPDDDGGRDDLWLWVESTSLAQCKPREKMRHILDLWAPWMSPEERDAYVEHVWGLDFYQRIKSAKELGERLGVTNAERERLKLWQFKPIDMTDEELAAHRKRKNNERRRTKRSQTRAEYLASCTGKPWEAEGISRAKWYRLRRETSPDAIIVFSSESIPVSPKEAESQQKGLQGLTARESQCKQQER
jgi:hypothetical protein